MATSNTAGLAKGNFMNSDNQQKLAATLQILRECQIEDAVKMLDELAANRGFRATTAGHYLALLKEDADCQFDIYSTPSKTSDELDEKIDAIEYALGALKICREIRRLGVDPVPGSALP